MKILIDTNIFIDRENPEVTQDNIQELIRNIAILKYELYTHPLTKKEILDDKDLERRKIILSKIGAYNNLDKYPDYKKDEFYISKIGKISNENDEVDCQLLYAVYKNAINLLITQDNKLRSRAKRIELEERVLNLNEALDLLRKSIEKPTISHPPALSEEYCYNINLNDPFFNSLKQDYSSFEQWFQKIALEHRKCWVYRYTTSQIGAILIIKEENEPIEGDIIIPKKYRLKLCTFKTEYRGNKLGELFLKMSFDYCVKHSITELYLTIFPKQKELIELINEYGFKKATTNRNGEEIYVKSLIPPLEVNNYLDISSTYFPSFFDGPQVNKYIIPIQPKWHERLFPEHPRQATLEEFQGRFIIPGNCIKKAYLSHSGIKLIRRGDLVLFYRSVDEKALTAIGTVESLHTNLYETDKIKQWVIKRTVYSDDELITVSQKKTLVILFKLHFYFKDPISLDCLLSDDILKSAPQTITRISHESYLKVKKRGGINGRYTVDKTGIL